MIHYKQMEKPDRDPKHALRAEEECRQVLVQFPNSKFAPRAQQLLRNIQEVVADAEFRVGAFYHTKGSLPAAANRLQGITDHYPLYSAADESLWLLGDAYTRMGTRFRDQAGKSYARIVRDYPLSAYADQAKKKLEDMEMAVPEADPVALARMKYEQENREKAGIMGPVWGIVSSRPGTKAAAKSGQPTMTSLRPTIPESVPKPAATTPGFTGDVTASAVTDTSALDTKPDARQSVQQAQQPAPAAEPLPSNRQVEDSKSKKGKKDNKK
jgi:outer membrane protein assembly factor BamD